MPAYWLARVRVTNPDRFFQYVERTPPIIAAHGGRHLGTGKHKVLEGAPNHDVFLVLEFPSMEAAEACYSSEPFQDACKLREGAGEVEIVLVEGRSLEDLQGNQVVDKV